MAIVLAALQGPAGSARAATSNLARTTNALSALVPTKGVSARLAALETRAPGRPDRTDLLHEWQNLHIPLRKARFLLDGYLPTPVLVGMVAGELDKAERSIDSVLAGKVGGPMPGLREEGYYCENDDSFQPFLRFVPSGAGSGTKPLVVYLHGYSPFVNLVNWAFVPTNLTVFAEQEQVYLVAPFARGNTDFQGIGEQDTLRAIDEMIARYPIDRDRIILSGASMGGMGVWTIGAHHPDRFAGLLVVSGRGDYYFWQGVARESLPGYKQDLMDTEFGFSLLPNLATVPVFCLHGSADSLIDVSEARHMIKAVRRVNPDVRYVELEDEDHWIQEKTFARRDVREWMLAQRREMPGSFRYRSFHPMYAGSHWLRIPQSAWRGVPVELEVATTATSLVVSAANATSATVFRAGMPVGARDRPVRAQGGLAIRSLAGSPPAPKVPLRGPVKQAFLGPFVFVRAAGEPRESTRFLRAVQDWQRYAHWQPRIAAEESTSLKRIRSHNVFLFGEPETSPLIRQALAGAPVRVTEDSYVVGKRSFARKGNGLYIVRPSPWHDERLAVVQCGIPWGEGLPENHKYDFLPDYIVYSRERDPDGSNHALCAGFFARDGSLDPARQYLAP